MVRRKLIAAREDLAEKLIRVAERRGLTFYRLVNEVIEQALRAEAMGASLKEILDEHGILDVAKRSGFTLTIERLLYEVLEGAFKVGQRKLTQKWREMGQWYGRYCSASRPEDSLDAFKEVMNALTWNASEFELVEGEKGVTVRCISPKFSPSYTQLFSSFLEGAFEALGFECTGRGVSTGVIALEFKRG